MPSRAAAEAVVVVSSALIKNSFSRSTGEASGPIIRNCSYVTNPAGTLSPIVRFPTHRRELSRTHTHTHTCTCTHIVKGQTRGSAASQHPANIRASQSINPACRILSAAPTRRLTVRHGRRTAKCNPVFPNRKHSSINSNFPHILSPTSSFVLGYLGL